MRNTINIARIGALFLSGAIVLSLSACGDTEQQLIVDGPRNAYFQSDLAACKNLSQERQVDTSTAAGYAAVGGLVGAVDADEKGDRLADGLMGAAIGGLVGASSAQLEADEARDKIVINCMRGRGHRVVNG